MRLLPIWSAGTERSRLGQAGRAVPVAEAAGEHLPAHDGRAGHRGEAALAALHAAGPALAAAAERGRPVDELGVLAPLPRPGKVVAVGLQLPRPCHRAEPAAAEPAARFAKLPSAVIGHGAEIVWTGTHPPGRRRGRAGGGHRPPRQACACRQRPRSRARATPRRNDVSARDLQAADGQWVPGQVADTFCPV